MLIPRRHVPPWSGREPWAVPRHQAELALSNTLKMPGELVVGHRFRSLPELEANASNTSAQDMAILKALTISREHPPASYHEFHGENAQSCGSQTEQASGQLERQKLKPRVLDQTEAAGWQRLAPTHLPRAVADKMHEKDASP